MGETGVLMATEPTEYSMRLSRLTVDKLGVKLYDKASAVVAELIANSYDADAENVTVTLPVGAALAKKNADGIIVDSGLIISVKDDGHGMTPIEAQEYFLSAGSDRRLRAADGARSRGKKRPVMGRKGIGKLSPFGICKRIEVRSAGGERTDLGYRVSHFILDYDTIVTDEEGEAPVLAGSEDKTWASTPGTEVTLSDFLPKRVPDRVTFTRQVARRFSLAQPDFVIHIKRTNAPEGIPAEEVSFDIPQFQVELNEATKIVVDDRPVSYEGRDLPVKGWLAHGKQSIRDEEEAGVRLYARGKIVATTRDFEQPAGFTGEFTTRSYLVGEVHAEWLDRDDDDDLIRTDRQGILWDSEYGEALRSWGAALVKEIARKSVAPRRENKTAIFLRESNLEAKANERFPENQAVIEAVMEFGRKIGGFAQEDELADPEYVEDLAEIVLLVGPHQALIRSFQRISRQEDKTLEQLIPIFAHTRTAELASYAQIAHARVEAIDELRKVLDDPAVVEADLQNLIARAPWLIRPDWSVITDNRSLKTFRDRFVAFWKATQGSEINVAITYESKRPDFTLVHLGDQLHVVELKKPGHKFSDADYIRLEKYVIAFNAFFEENVTFVEVFPKRFVIDLVADGEEVKADTARMLFATFKRDGIVVRRSWYDFLHSATTAHAEFLDVHDAVVADGG